MKNHPRLGGLLLSVLGLGFSIWYWQTAMASARQHDSELYIHTEVMIFPSVVLMGLMVIVAPDRLKSYSEGLRQRKKNWRDFLFIGAVLIPGAVYYYFLRAHLTQLGYKFNP